MKIALTGGSGRIGQVIAEQAVGLGHHVVSIDRAPPPEGQSRDNLAFIQADVGDYDRLLQAFTGCDAVIHMAAIPSPGHHPDHVVHNNNVVGSYNALRAAAEHGIMRICQASSVNAIGLSWSRAPSFDYFPIDEAHANYVEEPYSLSKWICEQQGDSFARRYEGIRIASMRFHWVVPDRATAAARMGIASREVSKHLWAYTLYEAAARACLMSLDGRIRWSRSVLHRGAGHQHRCAQPGAGREILPECADPRGPVRLPRLLLLRQGGEAARLEAHSRLIGSGRLQARSLILSRPCM